MVKIIFDNADKLIELIKSGIQSYSAEIISCMLSSRRRLNASVTSHIITWPVPERILASKEGTYFWNTSAAVGGKSLLIAKRGTFTGTSTNDKNQCKEKASKNQILFIHKHRFRLI